MRYLASIGQKPMFGRQLLHLHCKEVDKYTWQPVKEELAFDINHKFSPGILVIAHITAVNHRVQRIEEATEAIISTLRGFSNLGVRYRELSRDIEDWKTSMQFQIEELRRREEEIMQRAEALHLDLVCTILPANNLAIPDSLENHSESELEFSA